MTICKSLPKYKVSSKVTHRFPSNLIPSSFAPYDITIKGTFGKRIPAKDVIYGCTTGYIVTERWGWLVNFSKRYSDKIFTHVRVKRDTLRGRFVVDHKNVRVSHLTKGNHL